MVWVGVRQQRLPVRLFGILLQLLAGIFFMADLGAPAGRLAGGKQRVPGRAAVGGRGPVLRVAVAAAWAGAAPGGALAGVSAVGLGGDLVGARRPARDRSARALPPAGQRRPGLLHRILSLSFGWLARRLAWPMTRYPALALLPLMVLVAMASADHDAHPFAHFGYLAWPLPLPGSFSCCAGTKHPPAATWSGSTRWACGCSRRSGLGEASWGDRFLGRRKSGPGR
jgi:hypothetical protein